MCICHEYIVLPFLFKTGNIKTSKIVWLSTIIQIKDIFDVTTMWNVLYVYMIYVIFLSNIIRKPLHVSVNIKLFELSVK